MQTSETRGPDSVRSPEDDFVTEVEGEAVAAQDVRDHQPPRSQSHGVSSKQDRSCARPSRTCFPAMRRQWVTIERSNKTIATFTHPRLSVVTNGTDRKAHLWQPSVARRV